MRPEALLAGAAVATLLAMVVAVALVPGIAEPPTPREPPARVDVTEATLAAGEVTGATATLDVTVFLRQRGGTPDNVTVVVRATDAESGLVADVTEQTVDPDEWDGEQEVPAAVTVPREGGYEIRTLVYVDGQRVDSTAASVSGVGALTPPYARTSVSFQQFRQLPPIEYRVESATDDRATLAVTSYLSNGGDEAESNLRLVLTARQADSNVIADRTEIQVGDIAAGRTATPEATLTVPDGYNYYLDATLWRDGVVLESTRAAANLDPQETISVNETRRDVAFETSDFETGGPGGRPREEDAAATPGAESQPGFGPAVAVLALLSGLFAARRWSR
ncbi:MAG: PGF-CTERM protein [Natronomonas sp.]|jgi:PGF-CTERM protein|uniref:DUF7490 domain-containing protein n=1 Tax=Natronomonas sp. TaxID=2184060 RepID=UPI003988EEFC